MKVGRGAREQRRVVDLGADGGVRAVQRALAALDAEFRIPHRDLEGDVALLPAGGVGGPDAVVGQGRHRQQMPQAGHDGRGHLLEELRGLVGHERRLVRGGGRPRSGT